MKEPLPVRNDPCSAVAGEQSKTKMSAGLVPCQTAEKTRERERLDYGTSRVNNHTPPRLNTAHSNGFLALTHTRPTFSLSLFIPVAFSLKILAGGQREGNKSRGGRVVTHIRTGARANAVQYKVELLPGFPQRKIVTNCFAHQWLALLTWGRF